MTYSHVVEKKLFALAVQWLQDPTIKLISIAAELGYSKPAHFAHAFKRWTGISPHEFRTKQ